MNKTTTKQTRQASARRPHRRATLAAQIEVRDYEVIATIQSQSKPDRSYSVILNRYTGRVQCPCQGFARHGHCKHSEALYRVALDENLIIKVRRGKPAEAKAVIDDYDPFADSSLGLDLADLTPAEAEYADRLASEAEINAYQTECQARYFAGGC